MFELLLGKRKQNKGVIKPQGTLEELRRQDRNLPPRFPAYPFTLMVKNGIEIPYTLSVEGIKPYLKKDMVHFEAGMIALAWKGNEDSFCVMTEELQNRDYYRRKVALENIVYHDLFSENSEVLGIAVLDGHDIVVKSALKKVLDYHPVGIREEILMAMECWPSDAEIQKMCKMALLHYRENYALIMGKHYKEKGKREQEELIFRDSSQYILKERMTNLKYFNKYLTMVRHYKPGLDTPAVKELIEKLADEGCGYAALATTIVQHYADKEKAFFDKFKCELMQNGEYVTDLLMLDFYCMTDKENRGMTVEQMRERFEKYCNSYGIGIKLEVFDTMDVQKCENCLRTGYLLLFAGHFTMYYKKYHITSVNGWHIMNICDVQPDGTLTAVTWGKKYTLKNENLKSDARFVHVKYEF